jgi:hypothetical protein
MPTAAETAGDGVMECLRYLFLFVSPQPLLSSFGVITEQRS